MKGEHVVSREAFICAGGIGDFIAGVYPLCEYLKKTYGVKEQDFWFFMGSGNVGIVKYFYPQAATVVLPRHNRLVNYVRYGLRYRHLNFDMGIITYPDYPRFDSLFMYALGAKRRYGRIGGSVVAKWLLNCPTKLFNFKDAVDDSVYHTSVCNIRTFDVSYEKLDKKLYPRFPNELLDDFVLKNAGPYVMVEVSNNRYPQQLSHEKMARVLNKCYETNKFSVLITGKTADEGKAKALKQMLLMPSEVHITPSMEEFLAYVCKADILLVGNGGLSHIAASMGKKVIDLHSCSLASHWKPLGDYVVALQADEHIDNTSDEDLLKYLGIFLDDYR